MLKNSLITFGCSWMFGWNILEAVTKKLVYLSPEEIKNQTDIADEFAFRSLLSQRMGLKNINFSSPGVSNDHQFRLANEAFLKNISLANFIRKSENLTVIWAITDLHRFEYWDPRKKDYKNMVFSLGTDSNFAKSYMTEVFDLEQKNIELAYQIRHWQLIFDSLGITHYWINLFNTNDYRGIVDTNRFIFPGSNLLSEMSGLEEKEHYANHGNDAPLSPRLKVLIEKGLANSVTGHPTVAGHEKIAEMILSEIS